MPIKTGIGFSNNPDNVLAAKEAAETARKQLGQDRIDMALVFNTAHYAPEVFLPAAHDALKKTKLIGSSTAGIILPEGVATRGIAILALFSDTVRFECAAKGHLDLQDISLTGKALAKDCMTDFGQQHRKLFLFFADGLLNNVSGVIDGVKDQLGDNFLVVGGGSSDNFRFLKTYQYYNDTTISPGIAGMLLGGRINVAMSCRHGWRPLGKPRLIDRVDGHIIKIIGGQPATRLYEDFFLKDAGTMAQNPLGPINIRYPLGTRIGHTAEYLLRNVFSTLDDGSVICQDKLDQDSAVHIMITNGESCIQAAQRAAREVKDQIKNRTPALILVFESAARHKLLGRNAPRELQAIRDVLGPAPLLGMHTYGEIFTYPWGKNISRTLLQNDSIIIMALY